MTSEELAMLSIHATPTGDGRWMFDSRYPRSAEEALKIIKVCLYLGVGASDTISTDAWSAIVNKIAALEKKVNDDTWPRKF